jgi:hypothetical protein
LASSRAALKRDLALAVLLSVSAGDAYAAVLVPPAFFAGVRLVVFELVVAAPAM